MYVYTNILCYSSIIYICSMHMVYFLHNFISISSFSSIPYYIICNPVCFDQKCFILFHLVSGLISIIVLYLLLPLSPSLFRALIVLSFSDPFSESNIFDWEPLWDPFSADQFEFSKSFGEVTTYWFQIFLINWRSYRGSIHIHIWWLHC